MSNIIVLIGQGLILGLLVISSMLAIGMVSWLGYVLVTIKSKDRI